MMEFTFEDSLWEQKLQLLPPNSSFSAVQFLALMEGEDELALEDAFDLLANKGIRLDLKDLPADMGQGEAAVRLRQEQLLAQKDDMAAELSENDPLRLYLEELAALPLQGDEKLLIAQYLDGNEEAAQKLSAFGLSRVVEMAREYTGFGVLLLDLIQEGSLGLWQGILGYTGGDYSAHINRWICHYMERAVTMQAKDNGIGQKLRQAMADYRDTDQRLLSQLGRNPTVEEIAQAMHVTAEDAMIYSKMLDSTRQQAKIAQPEEDLPQEEEQAVEDTAYFQMRQRITELLSVLPEQEAKLLTLRFGLEGAKPMTPEETGKLLGMTPDEVVAAEAAALTKLRTQ